MVDLTKQLTHTLRIYFDSQINKHKINVQFLMQKGVGVAEHNFLDWKESLINFVLRK